MIQNINEIIDLIHPTASGIGIFTTDQIWILFNREIDESTISAGNFFITGPDFDIMIGAGGLQLFNNTASSGSGSNDILESPGYQGLVQGQIDFERISTTNLDTISGIDVVGSGYIYRTKAIFTPTNRLQSETEYSVYLSGDEDVNDSFDTGISERTVFDPIANGANTGTGSVIFNGGYIGPVDDVFTITITTAGEVGDSKFTFERSIDPFSVFGPFRTKRSGVLLSDGVYVDFSEGIYEIGDSWTVLVKRRNIFSGNLNWTFKTGSGNVKTIPTTTSTTVLGDIPITVQTIASSSTTILNNFTVESTNPSNGATNIILPINNGDYKINARLSFPIDLFSVASGISVSVFSEVVTGELDVNLALGELVTDVTASGQDLFITVASGQLRQNNLITVTIDDSLQSIEGNNLPSDYIFYFSTEYFPLYCTVRRLRLFAGVFLNEVPDDTLNLAIHVASQMADELTWNKFNLDDSYYKFVRHEWTCCKALEILLLNATGGSSLLKSKRLGDLSVEYDTSGLNINEALKRATECQLKWEGALMAGGRQVQSADLAIKGALDPDRPNIGRNWCHQRNFNFPSTPAANKRVLKTGKRRFTNIYSRLGSKGWWNR